MSIWIGAIPDEDDYVWKISSEKIPHLTILYLEGEVSDDISAQIAEYVQHAAKTSLNKFSLMVKKRGELGQDSADVLYFDKNYDTKKVAEFRNHLLANEEILKLYKSSEQFPEWIPHLTLGYPESPAKPDDRDYPGIHYINFNKIAVWYGDYEGPEFELESYDYGLEVSMSSVTELDDVIKSNGANKIKDLLQYGVKGQKWGVRKGDASGGFGLTRKGQDKLPTNVSVTQPKPGTKAKATGGKNQPLSDDAIRTAAQKQKAKASTTDALSNQELKQLVERMQLEANYTRLSTTQKSAGKKFVEGILVGFGKQKASQFVNNKLEEQLQAAFARAK